GRIALTISRRSPLRTADATALLSQKRNINSIAGFAAVSHRRRCGNHRARVVDPGRKKRDWTPTAKCRISHQSFLWQQRARCHHRTDADYDFPLSRRLRFFRAKSGEFAAVSGRRVLNTWTSFGGKPKSRRLSPVNWATSGFNKC